jgi:predicted TPR repeat methyltransferase
MIPAMAEAPTDSSDGAAAGSELRLTPEQALAFAIERHQLEQLDEAEAIYAALLERWPEHPDVLSHMGVLQHQRGEHAAALALLRRASEVSPDSAGIWNNLGNVLKRLEQRDEAERAFRRSLAIAESPQALSNLGSLLRRRKLWAEGEAACRRAIEIDPAFGDAWHHLALLLVAQGQVPEAIVAASRAIVLAPPHKRRRESYTRALVDVGEIEEAIAMYREWLVDEPDNAYVRHHLAACVGTAAPERASDAYVEQVFDDFAANFDAKLASLGYRAPDLVAEAVAARLPAPARQFDVADLGCGTGLCGPLLAPWARRLAGCDLSAAMLSQAERRGVYDELAKAELMQFLLARPRAFDVVVSADTLCYFGALEGVVAAARTALRPSGQIVFTVEAARDEGAPVEAGFRLQLNGRDAHTRAYLAAVLEGAGFDQLRIEAEVLRSEAGEPVRGWVAAARCADAVAAPPP